MKDGLPNLELKLNHAANAVFAAQPFRSAIEDVNQTIKCCGFGSHHKNTMVERRIQTITLGAIKLLLHEIYILVRGNNFNVMAL